MTQQPETRRIYAFHCPVCGNPKIVIRTDAEWDSLEQKWLESCSWEAYCCACGWIGNEGGLVKEYMQ